MFETRYLTGRAVPCIPALLYGLLMRQVYVMLRQMQDISTVNLLTAAALRYVSHEILQQHHSDRPHKLPS